MYITRPLKFSFKKKEDVSHAIKQIKNNNYQITDINSKTYSKNWFR